MSAFWEGTRGLYAPFESDLRSCSTDVYLHEMPGGALPLLRCAALQGSWSLLALPGQILSALRCALQSLCHDSSRWMPAQDSPG